jgi:hypothetical protein
MSLVAVAGAGIFAPGYAPVDPGLQPSAALLDRSSRRRASPLTRAMGDAYKQALEEAALDPTEVASVFGLALGEASTMIGLLDQMWRANGVVSPMRFAGSVHNTSSGAISIGTRNTGITTSIAADFDTPAVSLLEAIAIVQTHGVAVIAACGDEAAPVDLVVGDQGWGCLAAAVALVPADGADPRFLRLSAPHRGSATIAPADLPRALAQNPNAGLLDLIEALRRGETGSVRLDRGRGHGYCIEIARTV